MRLGLLWPADGRNDAEFWRWLPTGVDLLIARYDVGGTLELAQIEADTELGPILGAANLLRHARPVAVGLGDCAGSFVHGPGADLQLARAVQNELRIPALTMSTAMVQAVRHLGCMRVAVLSPYDEAVTLRLCKFLEGHGIAVTGHRSASLDDEERISSMPAGEWLELARRVMVRESEGLIIAGGGLSLSSTVSTLERELARPVVTGPGSLMWGLLKAVGVAPEKRDRGVLFGAKRPPDAQSTLRRHLSHATKAFAVSERPPVFTQGSGARLTGQDGKTYLDFACGSGTTALGHGHPRIMEAVRAMLDRGLTHSGPHFHTEAQIALYHKLARLLPPQLQRFQPATNGTEATEIALKAAMHFTGKRKFLAFEGSYHGRSLGALAVSSPRGRGLNAPLQPFAPDALFLPFNCSRAEIENAMAGNPGLAGVIVEPVQATEGMILPRGGFLDDLRAATADHGVPLIYDEVFTGYARTGSLFYFEQADTVPDLLILAKAFGGGFPAALVAGRENILTHWKPGTQSSTFQLHPIAATASAAVLDAITEDGLASAACHIGQIISDTGQGFRRHACVKELRGIGAMHGLEIVNGQGEPDQPRTKAIRRAALERGLITWECGSHSHVIGLVPPLTVSEAEISEAISVLDQAIADSA